MTEYERIMGIRGYLIGDRVHVPIEPYGVLPGTVTGKAAVALVTTYIVTLDRPLTLKGYEGWTTLPATSDVLTPQGSDPFEENIEEKYPDVWEEAIAAIKAR